MNELREAYERFWNGFGVCAYPAGYLPFGHEGIEFPYITYEAVCPAAGEFVPARINVWGRETAEVGDFRAVDAVIERIAEGIPCQNGKVIPCGEGKMLWVMRGNPFVVCLDEPKDRFVTRGILRVLVKSFGV